MEDRIKLENRQKVVYFSRCPNVTCNEKYVGEKDRRINKRVFDQNKTNKTSHLL